MNDKVSSMVWCAYCTRQQPAQLADSGPGFVCCSGCGKVLLQQHARHKDSISFKNVACGKELASSSACTSKKFDLAKLKGLIHACKAANASHSMSVTARKSAKDAESLTDIDDAEIAGYLLKKEETQYKKIIWEALNNDYLKQQAERKVAAANAEKLKKERPQRRPRTLNKYQDCVKAIENVQAKKRPSSKVNYDVLNQILGGPEPADNSMKKRRTTLPFEDEAVGKTNADMEETFEEEEEEEDDNYNTWDQSGSHGDDHGEEEEYYYGNDDDDFF